MAVTHATNFVEAVRQRDAGRLHTRASEGHLSTACTHMANVSCRLGAHANLGTIHAAIETVASTKGVAGIFADVFEPYQEHLAPNGVRPPVAPEVAGARVTLDSARERFVGALATEVNAVAAWEYRKPFVVPAVA